MEDRHVALLHPFDRLAYETECLVLLAAVTSYLRTHRAPERLGRDVSCLRQRFGLCRRLFSLLPSTEPAERLAEQPELRRQVTRLSQHTQLVGTATEHRLGRLGVVPLELEPAGEHPCNLCMDEMCELAQLRVHSFKPDECRVVVAATGAEHRFDEQQRGIVERTMCRVSQPLELALYLGRGQ